MLQRRVETEKTISKFIFKSRTEEGSRPGSEVKAVQVTYVLLSFSVLKAFGQRPESMVLLVISLVALFTHSRPHTHTQKTPKKMEAFFSPFDLGGCVCTGPRTTSKVFFLSLSLPSIQEKGLKAPEKRGTGWDEDDDGCPHTQSDLGSEREYDRPRSSLQTKLKLKRQGCHRPSTTCEPS